MTTHLLASDESAPRSEASNASRSRVGSVLLALVPFAAVGLLYLFAWDTSRAFGEWPSYSNPDPKAANGVLYALSGVALMASVPSVVLLAVGLPIVRRLRLDRIDASVLALAAAGMVLLYVVFSGNLGDWYVD